MLNTLTHTTPSIEQQTTPQDSPPKRIQKVSVHSPIHTTNRRHLKTHPARQSPPSKKSDLFFFAPFFFLSCLRFPWNLGSAAWAVALLYHFVVFFCKLPRLQSCILGKGGHYLAPILLDLPSKRNKKRLSQIHKESISGVAPGPFIPLIYGLWIYSNACMPVHKVDTDHQ